MNERVGDAQRNHVTELLGRALEEGYLDLGEYDQRMIGVGSARTVGELTGQVADLPAQFRWSPQQVIAPVPGPAYPTVGGTQPGQPRGSVQALSVASVVLGAISLPLTFCLGVGGLFGIAAMGLAVPGLRRHQHFGLSVTGFVLGCLGLVAGVAMLLLFVLVQSPS